MQVDIAQLHKALGGLLSQSGGLQDEMKHIRMYQSKSWIVDKAETEESAAEIYCLNTTVTRLCYEHPKDK